MRGHHRPLHTDLGGQRLAVGRCDGDVSQGQRDADPLQPVAQPAAVGTDVSVRDGLAQRMAFSRPVELLVAEHGRAID